MSLAVLRSPAASTGYGNFGQNLVLGLRQIGARPEEGDDRNPPPKTDVAVWASVPSYVPGCWSGQFAVSYTMWESTRLPESFRARLHEFDLVCVPCDQNVELFSPYHPDVRKVSLGYDSDTFVPLERHLDRELVFLVPATGARKGHDLIERAFPAAFPHWQKMDPRPRVVVKAHRYTIDAPWAECHVGPRPISFLLDLYRQAHCLVMPSRGEGWGYHPQQAVATAMPAICSEVPAHMEYAHLPGFLTVPVRPARAAYFIHGDPGNWWEPDLDHLIGAMRTVYEQWAWWQQDARKGAARIRAFDHRAMARNLISQLPSEPRVLGDWRPFQEKVFRVEVTKPLTPGIGPRNYVFLPGHTYWESADVRRVLWEAGYLTPDAQADDEGRLAHHDQEPDRSDQGPPLPRVP